MASAVTAPSPPPSSLPDALFVSIHPHQLCKVGDTHLDAKAEWRCTGDYTPRGCVQRPTSSVTRVLHKAVEPRYEGRCFVLCGPCAEAYLLVGEGEKIVQASSDGVVSVDSSDVERVGSVIDVWEAAEKGKEDAIATYLQEEEEGGNDVVDVLQRTNDRGMSLLSVATFFDHMNIVRLVCEALHIGCSGEDGGKEDNVVVASMDVWGRTAFSIACEEGHVNVVRYLFREAKVDVFNLKKFGGYTPLVMACSRNHVEVVRFLVEEAKADVNLCDDDGKSPFYNACRFGSLQVVQYLAALEEVDVTQPITTTKDGHTRFTPFYAACDRNHVEVVRFLAEMAKVDVNVESMVVGGKGGFLPFTSACIYGNLDIVRYLVEVAQVDVNRANTQNGKTPLGIACEKGHFDVVKYLVQQAKANVFLKSDGKLPAQCASKIIEEAMKKAPADREDISRHVKIVSLLEPHYFTVSNVATSCCCCPVLLPFLCCLGCCTQTDGSIKEFHDDTSALCFPLMKAIVPCIPPLRNFVCCCGKGCCSIDLIPNGFDEAQKEKCLNNVLPWSCYAPICCPFMWILGCCVSPNFFVRYEEGKFYWPTCMITSRLRLCHTCCSCCLSEGSFYGVNGKDDNGDTALHALAQNYKHHLNKHHFTASFLLAFGADAAIESNNGETALMRAAWNKDKIGRRHIFDLLVSEGCDPLKDNISQRCPLDYVNDDDELLSRYTDRLSLHLACKHGKLERVMTILEQGECTSEDVSKRRFDPTSNISRSAIEIACNKGHVAIAKALLVHFKDVDLGISLRLVCEKATLDDELIVLLLSYPTIDINLKAGDSKTAFMSCTDQAALARIFVTNVVDLYGLQANNFALWSHLVQMDTPGIVPRLLSYVAKHPHLVTARDANGRLVLGLALDKNRQAINEATLFLFGRFQLNNALPPMHRSATSVVYYATDEDQQASVSPSSSSSSSSSASTTASTAASSTTTSTAVVSNRVALKFMSEREQWEREVATRRNQNLDSTFVVGVLASYDAASNTRYGKDLARFGLADYRYCIVMPAADRSLKAIIDSERIAGRNWDAVRLITIEMTRALGHLHSRGLVHGDIKPLNVVRVSESIKLIDLDASTAVGTPSAAKFSSGYLPPELFFHSTSSGEVVVRRPLQSSASSSASTLEYDTISASPAQDMWALGCVLFQLCSGETLLQTNDEDNLTDQANYRAILTWESQSSSGLKACKLAKITDPLARNFCSQLLSGDPLMRPHTAEHVLAHPFLTGHKVGRLPGQSAEFDVFISYRVVSEKDFALAMYEKLTAAGLRVWLDVKRLVSGLSWEAGFCDGLIKSRTIVCLLSRAAIKTQFETLVETSNCDNVLLEQRLALELQERGLIERIFPIFISDVDAITGDYGDYFSQGCHPRLDANSSVAVATVEAKLHEHLERQGLGLPFRDTMSVKQVLDGVCISQGGKVIGGSLVAEQDRLVGLIKQMVLDMDTITTTTAVASSFAASTSLPTQPWPQAAAISQLEKRLEELEEAAVRLTKEKEELTKERDELAMVVKKAGKAAPK